MTEARISARPRRPLPALAASAAVFLIGTSFLCSENRGGPGLPPVAIDSLRLLVFDPELGVRGAHVAWSYPESSPATAFELYRSFRLDSLGPPLRDLPPQPRRAQAEIPDTSPPFTVYFGLRAVAVEPTGQKSFGDSIAVDSLRVLSLGTIHRPGNGDVVRGRQVEVEVRTGSDPGQKLRQLWYEKRGGAWALALDTCLPRSECDRPLFGTVTLFDTIVLGGSAQPVPTLFCALATTEGNTARGLQQALACSRFERVE